MQQKSWTHEGRPTLPADARGPWDHEPDKVHWIDEATDMDCLAVRNPMGAWCGYVAVNPGHPLYGVGYSECTKADCGEDWCYEHTADADVRVHGGLTFAAFCHESDKGEGYGICHTPLEGRPEKVWWFGFDCAHGGDLVPGMLNYGNLWSDGFYRSLGYVQDECASLARQLKAVTS